MALEGKFDREAENVQTQDRVTDATQEGDQKWRISKWNHYNARLNRRYNRCTKQNLCISGLLWTDTSLPYAGHKISEKTDPLTGKEAVLQAAGAHVAPRLYSLEKKELSF